MKKSSILKKKQQPFNYMITELRRILCLVHVTTKKPYPLLVTVPRKKMIQSHKDTRKSQHLKRSTEHKNIVYYSKMREYLVATTIAGANFRPALRKAIKAGKPIKRYWPYEELKLRKLSTYRDKQISRGINLAIPDLYARFI